MSPRRLAVTLHDVEPATFNRCALIRDWLTDHGVDRVTLLVIPAPDLHAFDSRRPELATWLVEREREGDAVAQHGFHHVRGDRRRTRRWDGSAEFIGLDERETTRAIDAGRRVLKLAGLEPRGFVAPAYAYTPQLRDVLAKRFSWWAGLMRLHSGQGDRLAPAIGMGGSDAILRATSPWVLRACAQLAGSTLRLDVHPADLDRPRHMMALESVLKGARRREPATLDELALAAA
jgi:predicted deacetylase